MKMGIGTAWGLSPLDAESVPLSLDRCEVASEKQTLEVNTSLLPFELVRTPIAERLMSVLTITEDLDILVDGVVSCCAQSYVGRLLARRERGNRREFLFRPGKGASRRIGVGRVRRGAISAFLLCAHFPGCQIFLLLRCQGVDRHAHAG